MQWLIVFGDPGIRKDGVIEYDGEEKTLFSVTRQGDYHGPDEAQLWCLVGDESEREDYEKRNFIPHWLDVERVDADAVEVVEAGGDLAVSV
jgi:hypothetical protein